MFSNNDRFLTDLRNSDHSKPIFKRLSLTSQFKTNEQTRFKPRDLFIYKCPLKNICTLATDYLKIYTDI